MRLVKLIILIRIQNNLSHESDMMYVLCDTPSLSLSLARFRFLRSYLHQLEILIFQFKAGWTMLFIKYTYYP